MKLKSILLSGILALGATVASAQPEPQTEYVFNPHWYVQLQVGGQYTLGELAFEDLLSPNVQVGVGYEFTKVVGARFSINAWQSKGGIVPSATTEYDYKYKYVAPMVDVTFNLTNLFCEYNPKRVVNVGIFGGVGANIGFDNDEAVDLDEDGYSNYLKYVWDDSKVRFAARLGANVDFRLSDAVSLGIEASANTLNDKYNSKKAGNADWYFNALVGLKINLGKSYTTRQLPPPPAPVERVVERIVEKPAPAPVAEEKKPLPPAKIRREIFFTINSNQIREEGYGKIQEVVEFMNANPESEVSVTGYADKGTGTKAINERLAKKRADIVTDELVNRGIARDRIKTDSMGDRVQPFNDNDMNRVTICIAE